MKVGIPTVLRNYTGSARTMGADGSTVAELFADLALALSHSDEALIRHALSGG